MKKLEARPKRVNALSRPVAGRYIAKLDLSRRQVTPSEYLARNVRAAALLAAPVEYWFERYPHLEDVYCYASNYP
jgi:hypothetical protein